MTISDFKMDSPSADLNCRRLRGFHLDVFRDEEGNPNGLCENCTYAPSTHVFNISATQHHLCAKCFDEMLMCFVGDSVGHSVAQSAKVEDAPSKTQRNCDVGTAEEQAERYINFCDNHPKCIGCPCVGRIKFNQCAFAWEQMPYEKDARNN